LFTRLFLVSPCRRFGPGGTVRLSWRGQRGISVYAALAKIKNVGYRRLPDCHGHVSPLHC